MPKTNVYPPNTPGDEAGRRIEVGWRTGSDVQVATTTPTPDSSEWDGQWVDLDRRGVNQLIRALREARDKAYGRDE